MTDKKHGVDELLQSGLVSVPEDFHAQVMQQVTAYENAQQQPSVKQQLQPIKLDWWQWLVLICGGVLGAGQVFRFIFAVWLVSAAG